MEYRILGPLEVSAAGRSLILGGQRQRRILAALLLGADRPVPLSQLIEAGWDDDPPASAAHQVRNRIAELRRLLTPVGGFIDTEGDGYRLRIGDGELDVAVFDELTRRGRAARDPALLRRALGLWRGPALAGVGGGWLGRHADRLDEQRLAVSEERFELELAAGDAAGLVDELGPLVTAHPLRERLVGLWMTALHRCGRRTEALSAYRSLASRLADELGIDPSPELRRRHDEISRDDGGAPHAVPAQLPRDVPGFVGRMGDLAALDGLLSDSQAGRTVVISAIEGTAGVGKTALAVHWAHRVRDKFPDGQLYVDLRGFDPSGTVKSPAEALRGFLDALGVPAQRVPADLDGQAALYRGALADKRMLVLLDNVRDTDQVRPLLPDAPDCLVVVASRNRLTDLTAEGAHPILLDLLTSAEAEQLLVRRLGAGRVAAEPDAVDRIIARCARLPLALAIVAARAADVDVALAALADELDRARGDLGPFTADDPRADVRAVFSWSHRALSGAAARLFRLLGLHAGPDFAAPAAASLVGEPVERVEALLAELTRAHLITEHAPGRFALHDLLRAYANAHADTVDGAPECRAAVGRLLGHYLHSACAAVGQLAPHRDPYPPQEHPPGTTVERFADHGEALAWYTAEHATLVAAVGQAADAGLDQIAWRLAWTLPPYFGRKGHWHDWIATQTIALAAARRLDDRGMQARTFHSIGGVHEWTRRTEEAEGYFRRALDLYRDVGDHTGQAYLHRNLAVTARLRGDLDEAVGHAKASLELYRAAGHRVGVARALNLAGYYISQSGDHRLGLTYCRQAVDLLQEVGDRHHEGATWDSVGYCLHHLGDYDEAIDAFGTALDISRELGDRTLEAEILVHLGDSRHAIGRPDATEAWRASLIIYEDLEQPEAAAVRAKLQR